MVPVRVVEYPLRTNALTLAKHCEKEHKRAVDKVTSLSDEQIAQIADQVNSTTP